MEDFTQKYANRMGELKERIYLAQDAVALYPEMGGPKMMGKEGFYFESVCLQIRKILELIAFGGMIANGTKYTAIHKNFIDQNKAAKIVKHLDALHPYWFPQHVNLQVARNQGHVQYAASGFNREQWIDIYDQMGTLLHVGNPFAGRTEVVMSRSAPNTLRMIQRHMQTHVAAVEGASTLICDLGDRDSRVNVYEAVQVDAMM